MLFPFCETVWGGYDWGILFGVSWQEYITLQWDKFHAWDHTRL